MNVITSVVDHLLAWRKVTDETFNKCKYMFAFRDKTIDSDYTSAHPQGCVYLIGAGAGDPELLTLKAHRLLQQADVILVDWLVNPELYRYFPEKAERIFVGKKCGQHSMTQSEICELMLQKALEGKCVIRLKGGDPSIFGRLAEETEILTHHDIPFTIIPGITAASGCAAYSGIPLTHRDCAQAVRFITAHRKNVEEEAEWEQLGNTNDTLVFYMGLNRVEHIVSRLMEHGMRTNMPVAIIDQGTLRDQKVCCKTLETIDANMHLAEFKGPALVIVGEVVNHRVDVALSLVEPKSATSPLMEVAV